MFRAVFWVVQPGKKSVDRRFRGSYCLHHPWWFYMAVQPRRQLWTYFALVLKNFISAAVILGCLLPLASRSHYHIVGLQWLLQACCFLLICFFKGFRTWLMISVICKKKSIFQPIFRVTVSIVRNCMSSSVFFSFYCERYRTWLMIPVICKNFEKLLHLFFSFRVTVSILSNCVYLFYYFLIDYCLLLIGSLPLYATGSVLLVKIFNQYFCYVF
jgi:hypothetical protein